MAALGAVAHVDFQWRGGGSVKSDETALAASLHCGGCDVQQPPGNKKWEVGRKRSGANCCPVEAAHGEILAGPDKRIKIRSELSFILSHTMPL